jgi:hypothetical protein
MLMALEQVEQKREEVEEKAVKTVAFVDKTSKGAYRRALTMARGVWQITETVLSAAGVSMSYQFKALMSAAFGTISVLIPLLTATALTPGMQWNAALGFAELGLALQALTQTQQQQEENENMMRAGMSILNSVQMMFRGGSYL